MAWCFSEVLADLAAGTPVAGERIERFLADLERVLEAELGRRGLRDRSPAYLGLYGQARWDREALAELAADCYLYQLARLRSLTAQLRVCANVDGYVVLNARHFVSERQRRQDPLGSRLYELLAAAVETLGATGELTQADEGRLAGDSVLVFAGGSPRSQPDPERLAAAARSWNDELVEPLLSAGSNEPLVAELVERLRSLSRSGVAAFRFGDLLDPWKQDARARWAGRGAAISRDLLGSPAGAGGGEVEPADPGTPLQEVEAREAFERLGAAVERRLDALPTHADVPELRALWRALRAYADDPARDEAPSDRALAKASGIPRRRLKERLARLAAVVAESRAAIGGAAPVRTDEEPSALADHWP
jgi:hypothetical protein